MNAHYNDIEEEIKTFLINMCVTMRNYGVGEKKRFKNFSYSHFLWDIMDEGSRTSLSLKNFKHELWFHYFPKKNNMSSIKTIKYILNKMVNFMDKNECGLSFISDYSIYNYVCFTELLAFYNN